MRLRDLIVQSLNDTDSWDFYDLRVGDVQRQDFADEVMRRLMQLHPAQLAEIVLEIQAIKEIRYRAPHPDYYVAQRAALNRSEAPKQPFARFTLEDACRMIDANKAELSLLIS